MLGTPSIPRYLSQAHGKLVLVMSVTGDNATGADNQQERLFSRRGPEDIPAELGYYFAGFADGEGSFNVSFRRRRDYRIPWKVSLSFNVSQKDTKILELFQRIIGCGTLRFRRDGVCYFEVTDLKDILEKVIPFFGRFPILSRRRRDFLVFVEIARLMDTGMHLTREGIERILVLRDPMNNGGKRKYSNQEILEAFENAGAG